MAMFSEKTQKKVEEFNKPYPAFKADTYIGSVNKVEVAETDEVDWTNGSPVPTGNKEDVVKFTLLLTQADGNTFPQVLDTEATKAGGGKMIYKEGESNSIQYWLNPTKIYVTKKKGATKGQAFLTSLLELLPDTKIDLKMLEEWIDTDEFMFKTLKVTVDLKGKDGEYKNAITGFMPKS